MKKKKRNKKKKPATSRLLQLLILCLFLVAAYFAITYLNSSFEPVTHSEHLPHRQQFVESGDPVIMSVYNWYHEEGLSLSDINQRLPEPYTLLVLNEDINANRAPNYVLISSDPHLPELNPSLKEAGYNHVFHSLIVYELSNNVLEPILTIDSNQIQNAAGNQLIDQVTASHGYALVLEKWEHPALYRKPVLLIEVVMLDHDGNENSDDITIYWDTSESTYKATNTFGAPL